MLHRVKSSTAATTGLALSVCEKVDVSENKAEVFDLY